MALEELIKTDREPRIIMKLYNSKIGLQKSLKKWKHYVWKPFFQ
jgi:hypothetical protein